MRDYIDAQLTVLLNQDPYGKNGDYSKKLMGTIAKTVTGLCGMLTSRLFNCLEPPQMLDANDKTVDVFPEPLWRVLRTLVANGSIM